MGSRKVIYVIVIFLLVISIGHFPAVVGEENSCVLYQEDVDTMLENGIYDFSGCTFKGDIELYKLTLVNANFKDAIFEGNVNFYKTKFQEGVDFCNATFKGDRADFTSAEFNGTANFDSAHFEEFVIFTNTIFYGNALFNNTTFKKYTDFTENEQETFQGEAEFNHAIFKKEVSFLDTTFKKNATFKWATFEDQVIFQTAKFENNVTFHKAIFEDYVQFSRDTIFGKEIGESEASFEETEFCDTTNFVCTFNANATFQSAKFNGNTYFVGTVFNESVDFKYAEFGRVSNFSNANFGGETNFNKAVFRDNVYFKNTNFGQIKEINLGAIFERMLIFRPTSLYKINLSDFQALEHTEIKADLMDAKFKDVYLKNVNFIDCKWPDDYKVYEERENILGANDLEKIYRNIKLSFQNYGDSEMAGHFFYREMEMKKKTTSFRSDPKGWILLRALWPCGYGERLFRLLICSLIVILGFAGLFWGLGIEINTLPRHNIEGFEIDYFRRHVRDVDNRYKIHGSHEHRNLDKIWSFFSWIGVKDFAYCLLFSITSFSTLGAKYIKPKGNASRWLAAIESLIGMFFIALFIYVFARKMLR